jgi:hypothetical protein
VKSGLKKIVGKSCLSRKALETTLIEVEATVNSRPLTFVGDTLSLYDLEVLTPEWVDPVTSSGTPVMPAQTNQSFPSMSGVLDVKSKCVVNSGIGYSGTRKTKSGRVIRSRNVLDL